MAFGRTIIGCTPYVGGIIAGIYSTAVYLTAFGVELGWIIEAIERLPSPAYILTAQYFCSLLLSLFLVVGLVLKNSKYLLGWLIIMMALFFPECGLVLFMSLYHWGLSTPHGLAEFIFYICRAVMNVLCIVCIHLLHTTWKKEKAVLRRLENLQLGSLFTDVDTGGTKDCHQTGNGHVNQEFVFRSSHSQESELLFMTSGSANPPRLSRSRSFNSVNLPERPNSVGPWSSPRTPVMGGRPMTPNGSAMPPASSYYCWNGGGSEFDAASFNEFLTWKMRNRPEFARGCSGDTQSDIFPSYPGSRCDWDGYFPGPPSVHASMMSDSMGSYSTQSLERLKGKKHGPLRRARSLSDINALSGNYFVLEKMHQAPFQYLDRPGSMIIDDADSTSTHSIRDVAL